VARETKKRSNNKGSSKMAINKRSADSSPILAVKLSKALGALAHDLANPADESTDYFRSFVAVLPKTINLNADTFKQALKIGSSYKIDLSPADDFSSNATDENNWDEDSAGFQLLEAVMRASLTDISLAFARRKGLVRIRLWLFGRAQDGTLVGLRAMTTET